MSLCPTTTATNTIPTGRLPSKADKEQKKNIVAISLLRALGELFISNQIEFTTLEGINPKEYRLFACTEFKNGTKVNKYIGFKLLTIQTEMQSARADFSNNGSVNIQEAKAFAKRLEKVLSNPKAYELTAHALTVIPAILAAENAPKISESPFCLASIIDILGEEKANFPDFFKNDGFCVIQ